MACIISLFNTEKDELMMRNAELSQQLTSSQQVLQDERKTFEKEKESYEVEIATKIENEDSLKQQCQKYEREVRQ